MKFLVFPFIILHTIAEKVSIESIFALVSDNRSVVGYDGALECTIRQGFCAVIFYHEADTLGADEDLKFVKLQCTNTNILYHNAHVILEGGDGPFDNNYDPTIHIYHDCVGSGKISQSIFLLPHVPIKKKWTTLQYKVNLDRGHNRWFYIQPQVIRAKYYRGNKEDQDLMDWYNGIDVKNRSNLFFDDSVRLHEEKSIEELKKKEIEQNW